MVNITDLMKKSGVAGSVATAVNTALTQAEKDRLRQTQTSASALKPQSGPGTTQSATSSAIGVSSGGGIKPYVADTSGQMDWSVLINDTISRGGDPALVQQYLNARNNKITQNGTLAQHASDATAQRAAQYIADAQKKQSPFQFGSLDEMREALGYNDVSAAEQAAINAYIKQAVTGLESQKSGIQQSADEAARQAYISYMQSQNALPQALAASGYSGGMADSQRLALETGLQNSQKDILLNRDNAINGVDTAIQQAQLEGSIQGAQARAALGRDAINAYQQYINQRNADAWQAGQTQLSQQWQSGESQKDRDWRSGESQADRESNAAVNAQKIASDKAWNIILAGAIPDDSTLEAAGISRAEAAAVAAQVKAKRAGSNPTVVVKGEDDKKGITQEQYNDAVNRFERGDYSQEVIAIMLAAGDKPASLASAAGFGDVVSLGYGPINDNFLAQKLTSGEVQAISIGGTTFYRKSAGSGGGSTGGSTGGSGLGFPYWP